MNTSTGGHTLSDIRNRGNELRAVLESSLGWVPEQTEDNLHTRIEAVLSNLTRQLELRGRTSAHEMAEDVIDLGLAAAHGGMTAQEAIDKATIRLEEWYESLVAGSQPSKSALSVVEEIHHLCTDKVLTRKVEVAALIERYAQAHDTETLSQAADRGCVQCGANRCLPPTYEPGCPRRAAILGEEKPHD